MKKFYGLLVFVFLLVGCGSAGTEPDKAESKHESEEASVELLISAAASLTDVLEEVKEKYAEEKPTVTLTFNMGPSGQLQQQIEQGAPADVFLSAAQRQMDELEEKELLIKETKVDIVGNELVLIAPTHSTLTSFEELKGDAVKHIGIGNPDSVPVGQYAREVLENINLWEDLSPKLVEGQNVRTVLSYVETGNAEAGFVYRSDTVASDKVKIIEAAPEGSASPILYPAAVVKASKHQDEAKAFVEFLQTDLAIEIFEQYGFKQIEK
ncbi:molybdate ABC transporter substrate-binding protein [Halalkalibacter krulwichiae]|uniref:Molybdate-binding periplasmic protein n=1 Tax=Halalkalibacter krulwichiae TaxID=199441 RepID=A0A1X9MGE7_9BACI|nr:molybdate ABC transporter substrate-binding protein [Halalkalibacter krulwichiae]ARK32527.1 Molybdate-binding periplasmic protein precursor [Halalkalibacter krulwichiae]